MSRDDFSPQSYFEIAFQFPKGRADLSRKVLDFLASHGIKSSALAIQEDARRKKISFYEKFRPGVRAFKSAASRELGAGVGFGVKNLRPKDWLDKWQQEYPIREIGKKWLLVPSVRLAEYRRKWKKNQRVPILLDPKSVFGSGTHASTQLVLKMLEKIGRPIDSFLDLGTGTGILSVGAGRLGCREFWAVDCDRQAVRTAKENLRLNALKGRVLRIDLLAKDSIGRSFDVVAANLFTSLLVRARKLIFRAVKPGGFLLVSGVYDTNARELRREFRHPDFRCLKHFRSRGWSAWLFKNIRKLQ